MFDGAAPIFLQLANALADDILRGRFGEGDQVPSTNELALFHRINPATAGKALNSLVNQGILIKRRGIGMFVATGAKAQISGERSASFTQDFIRPLLTEAQQLGLTEHDVIRLIHNAAADLGTPFALGTSTEEEPK